LSILIFFLLHQVLSGKIPYFYIKHDTRVIGQLLKGITPKRPSITWITDELWDFISGCWAEPQERPTITKVRDFIQDYGAQCGDSDVCRLSPSPAL